MFDQTGNGMFMSTFINVTGISLALGLVLPPPRQLGT